MWFRAHNLDSSNAVASTIDEKGFINGLGPSPALPYKLLNLSESFIEVGPASLVRP